MTTALAQPSAEQQLHELASVVDEVAHLLPAQGPITVFVHHNTLHAFEQLRFEDAVVRAGELFGCEPYMSEEFYRAQLRRGRITRVDIDTMLGRTLGAAGDEQLLGSLTRHELRARVLVHGIPELRGQPLEWILAETDALDRFRDDVPPEVREQVAAIRGGPEAVAGSDDERAIVRELWSACTAAVERLGPPPSSAKPPQRSRHRDLILAASKLDLDDWVDPILIRFVSAYLDQGLAQWSMSGRERGMYACFLDTFAGRESSLCGRWAEQLPLLIAGEHRRGGTGLDSLADSLAQLGVAADEWQEFLAATVLALPGFAGMVRQLQERPDRVPTHAVPATLVDFLAVRLLLERSAIAHAARQLLGYQGPLADLRSHLRERIGTTVEQPSTAERAWPLFQLAQLCGLDKLAISNLDPDQLRTLERELSEFDGLARRELLHLAYERHLRQRCYDAVIQHQPTPTPSEPLFQAIFCLDDREESIRRHIEELEPRCETFGLAGFYGVAMYFRGVEDAHPRPLCPVAITPQHYVAERLREPDSARARWRAWRRRGLGLVDKNIHFGSHTMVRGAIVMAVLGTLSLIPLVLRVVFPWLDQRMATLAPQSATRLDIDRQPIDPPIGRFTGFTTEEKVAIVRAQLSSIGASGRLAPLVFSFGHGSFSLNNPHASAYDCGACAGGRGGPNGRAFAQMANDPEVRAQLAALGQPIPASTWFVGGYRNSTDSSLTFYDLDRVPDSHREALEHALEVFERARRRDAHERCRRFELARLHWSSQAALRHVESRAADLAQPRAEAGHATNALCFVGRRSRLRGLFLDRRCFLTSYDPTADADASTLAGLLDAVVPVVAGINLEYYFSYVDPRRYGSGTKLPHNVSALLGVMDGAQSDLRTGLPWQMVELHEPVRTSMIVESKPELLAEVVAQSPTLTRLFGGRWLYLACLDPDSQRVWEWSPELGFAEQLPERPLATVRGNSRVVYRGKRGHLPFTQIIPDAGIETSEGHRA